MRDFSLGHIYVLHAKPEVASVAPFCSAPNQGGCLSWISSILNLYGVLLEPVCRRITALAFLLILRWLFGCVRSCTSTEVSTWCCELPHSIKRVISSSTSRRRIIVSHSRTLFELSHRFFDRRPKMPTTPASSSRPARDSWPPRPSFGSENMQIDIEDLSRIDEDPITYFLTPASPYDEEDEDPMADFDIDFDAGIEDAKKPPHIVRSVSPSNLDGLRLPLPRPPTPPRSPATPDLDLDTLSTPDDNEDYMRFVPSARLNAYSLPAGLGDSSTASTLAIAKKQPDAPSSPASNRGRPLLRAGPKFHGHVAGSASQPHYRPSRRSPHAWREPSPDVWSIEEETEEDVDDNMEDRGTGHMKTQAVEIPAAKPKKRVRFILPGRGE
jgi:hypothetical protein